MADDSRSGVKVWSVLVILYVVWGSTYLAIRYAVETIPPFIHGAIRFSVAGGLLLCWQRLRGHPWPTHRQWLNCALVGNLLLLGGNGLVAWAEQSVASGIAALIVALVPMFMVMIAALRPGGQRPTTWVVLGLLLGLAGIAVLVIPGSSHAHVISVLGLVALLGACLFWSVGSVVSKSMDLPSAVMTTTAAQMPGAAIGLGLLSLVTGEYWHWDAHAVSLHSMQALAYLIVIGSIVGFSSYAWLLKHAPLPLVSTYAYVNPIVAVLLGAWLAKEPVGPQLWIAAAMIIAAVMMVSVAKQPSRK